MNKSNKIVVKNVNEATATKVKALLDKAGISYEHTTPVTLPVKSDREARLEEKYTELTSVGRFRMTKEQTAEVKAGSATRESFLATAVDKARRSSKSKAKKASK